MVMRDISLNSRHKLIHFKFLRRLYHTPAMAHKIDPSTPHQCLKCLAPHADFAHLTWTCPKIQTYWKQIHDVLGPMTALTLIPTPEIALLGYTVNFPKKVRRFSALGLLLAKREIALLWGQCTVPALQWWLRSMAYCSENCELYASLIPSMSRPKDIWGP